MAFDQTHVDTDAMRGGVDEVDTQLALLLNAAGRLENVVAELRAGWRGPASQKFQARYRSDKEKLDRWIKDEQALNQELLACVQAYEEANDTVLSRMQALRGRKT